MRENSCECIVEKLRSAAKAREAGLNCPEALLEAYREELGENFAGTEELAARMPEILGEPELCDVFAATFAIIVRLTGMEDGYAETIARLWKEYGTSACGTQREETSLCTMRMKDCVLMIQWARANIAKAIHQN